MEFQNSTPFVDQNVASPRNRIISLLNEMGLAIAESKADCIIKVQELILGGNIDLLDEFLDVIISQAHDFSVDVRRTVIGFIEEACKVKIECLPRVVNVLVMSLKDSSVQIVKKVIQACSSIYRKTLQWLCSLNDISEEIEQAWNTMCLIKAQILDMIDNDNDGIRSICIKFLEGVVILQTYPGEDSMKRDGDFSLEDIPITLKLVRRRKLEDEALNIFDCLLKFHAASHISSVNLIACTGSLCTIAKLRPSLMNAVIEALRKLNSNLPPTLTDSQVSSVRKRLKVQIINLLKNPGSFEMQTSVVDMLQELGCTTQEIYQSTPKMGKDEQQRRTKRALENAGYTIANKRHCKKSNYIPTLSDSQIPDFDMEELNELKEKSLQINEAFIIEGLKKIDAVVDIVMESMKNLPETPSEEFLKNYTPVINISIEDQIGKISYLLAEQMVEGNIGPGCAITNNSSIITKSTAASADDHENIIIEQNHVLEANNEMKLNENELKKEEATKKLRENIQREKGEQALIKRMKQRVKTLKLQEITKPLTRAGKEQTLLNAIKRILNSERACIIGGASNKWRKVLTVMTATFPDNVKEMVFQFIMSDIKNRLDIAFSWLFEEYSLLQGFTRHSYIKSETSPDYAYNKLIGQIVTKVLNYNDPKDKILLLRRIFLESPMLPDQAVDQLIPLCEVENMSSNCLELIKDLAVRRPPRKQKFLKILLTFCVHQNINIRQNALENIITLYAVHKVLVEKIEEFALTWLNYINCDVPPAAIFGADFGRPHAQDWDEELTRICFSVFFALMPYHEEKVHDLTRVYIAASSDMKRIILRTLEGPIRKMGPDSFQLLKLIEQCPKGSETLITRIIYILTEKRFPTPQLVGHVRELFKTKVTDIRFLIPVLSGLTKKEILNALPKFLKLNPLVVKDVFKRLLCIGPEYKGQVMPLTPSEILIALHNIDVGKCDLKLILKATSICLSEKDVFTQEVLATCLQQLIEITPTPILSMRTIIQSLTLYPRLGPFVVNLLQRLILKQVWKQKVIWEGFLKCCQRLLPQSLSLLIQLPPQQLLDALNICPDLRQPLLDYAHSITENQIGHISQQTMDIISGNCQDVFVTDETGGYITLDNIKKEIEDPSEFIFPQSTGQPLPPGED